MPVHGERKVVPLDAGGGITQVKVTLPVSRKNICQRGRCEVTFILDRNALPTARNQAVVLCHNRLQILRKLPAALVDTGGQRRHLLVYHIQEGRFCLILLEHLIALGQQTRIPLHGRQVFRVHLRQDGIGQAAAFFSGIAHQGAVSRGDHNHRKHAYMLSQAGVGLLIADQLLLPFLHLDGEAGFQTVFHGIGTAYGKTFGPIAEVVLVRSREGAFGHGKVIDGIQEVGLPFPVVAADAVHVGRKVQFLEGDVPEIPDHYFLENGHRFIPIESNCKYIIFFVNLRAQLVNKKIIRIWQKLLRLKRKCVSRMWLRLFPRPNSSSKRTEKSFTAPSLAFS